MNYHVKQRRVGATKTAASMHSKEKFQRQILSLTSRYAECRNYMLMFRCRLGHGISNYYSPSVSP